MWVRPRDTDKGWWGPWGWYLHRGQCLGPRAGAGGGWGGGADGGSSPAGMPAGVAAANVIVTVNAGHLGFDWSPFLQAKWPNREASNQRGHGGEPWGPLGCAHCSPSLAGQTVRGRDRGPFCFISQAPSIGAGAAPRALWGQS